MMQLDDVSTTVPIDILQVFIATFVPFIFYVLPWPIPFPGDSELKDAEHDCKEVIMEVGKMPEDIILPDPETHTRTLFTFPPKKILSLALSLPTSLQTLSAGLFTLRRKKEKKKKKGNSESLHNLVPMTPLLPIKKPYAEEGQSNIFPFPPSTQFSRFLQSDLGRRLNERKKKPLKTSNT